MHTLDELDDKLLNLCKRYTTLKSNFENFHFLCKTHFENMIFNNCEISIESITNNKFNVELADRKLRFEFFTMLRKDTDVLFGFINCYKVDSSGEIHLNLREFEFKSNGESSYIDVDDGDDRLNITNSMHAPRIILYFLNKSFSK